MVTTEEELNRVRFVLAAPLDYAPAVHLPIEDNDLRDFMVLQDLFENPNRPIRRAINKYLFCGRLSFDPTWNNQRLIRGIQKIAIRHWRRDQFSPEF